MNLKNISKCIMIATINCAHRMESLRTKLMNYKKKTNISVKDYSIQKHNSALSNNQDRIRNHTSLVKAICSKRHRRKERIIFHTMPSTQRNNTNKIRINFKIVLVSRCKHN